MRGFERLEDATMPYTWDTATKSTVLQVLEMPAQQKTLFFQLSNTLKASHIDPASDHSTLPILASKDLLNTRKATALIG